MTEQETKIRRTARVRRGLKRAVDVLRSDLAGLRNEYRQRGMSKPELDDYEIAIEWLKQQQGADPG